jgi:hypothetical protein
MHDILVRPLPQHCRLIAMFDVSYINNLAWHTSTLTMRLQSCHSGTALGSSLSYACSFLMTYRTQDLPYIVCKLLFQTAHSRRNLFCTV